MDKLIKKIYKLKNGEIVEKEYNQSNYNKTYYEKNKDTLNIKQKCGCGGSYSIKSKVKHNNTRLHKLFERIENKV
jgi:hypothetical protein